MSRDINPQQGGFTLLELLLAMVLSVIVITAMSGIFKSVVDSSVAVDSEVLLNQQGRVLLNIFSKDLSSIVVNNATESSGGLGFTASVGVISSGDTFLSFSSANTLFSRNSTSYPINSISYRLEDAGDGDLFRLVRSSRKYSQLNGDWESRDLELSDQVQGMRLEFSNVGQGLTVGTKDFLTAKTLTMDIALKEGDSVRHYQTTIPFRPAFVNIPKSSK